MYGQRQDSLSLFGRRAKICSSCLTVDPPVEPAYGCSECGEAATLSQLDGQVPETCPWCGEGKLVKITDVACAQCNQGEVQERQVYPCPKCEKLYLDQQSAARCYCAPRYAPPSSIPISAKQKAWTEAPDGKVAYLRLECRARESRVKVGYGGRRCQGWQKALEAHFGGDTKAFRACVACAWFEWGDNPGSITVTGVEEHTHQRPLIPK